MSNKLARTKYNAGFFREMFLETGDDRFSKRADRMVQCLDIMLWDAYHKNKLLDLKKVNRCKDRFCPNCRSVSNALSIVKFEKPFKLMLEKGYMPFFVTLTVPNVPGIELKNTIDKMQKDFRKFFLWLSRDDKNSFKDRIFDTKACIKALEINVEKTRDDYYHPHFHIMLFLDNYNPLDFNKYIYDGVRRKGGHNMLSDADVFISKLWTMACEGIRLNKFKNLPDRIIYDNRERNYFMCDIRPMEMPGGIYEVFKYSFKDTDINHYNQFKTIFEAINGRRLKQGHGELYNIKIECDDEDMQIDESENINGYLEIKESPSKLVTKTLEELTTTYKAYRKISRFKGSNHVEHIN